MKKILMVSAVALACAAASPAFAASPYSGTPPITLNDDGNVDPGTSGITSTLSYEIEGANPAKCGVSLSNGYVEVTLGTDDITDASGFVNPNLANIIASKMNANGNPTAWCTGNHNAINLSRSALATGDGLPVNGFRKAVLYDLNVDIADATRVGGAPVLEGTSDGEGLGPIITAFGASGPGSNLVFSSEGQPIVPVDQATAGTLKRSDFDQAPATQRLLAGYYEGWVKLTITPGV